MSDAMMSETTSGPGILGAAAEPETELFLATASFAQRRLWLLDRVQPGMTSYNVPMGLRVHGPLDATVLSDTLAELVARHETLRTSFDEEEGEPVQVIAAELVPELAEIDLRGEADPEAVLRRLTAEEAARPFDLRRAPLFRALLFRLADDEHFLLFHLHHIITDGWSLGILVRELSTVYAAFAAGQPSPLPELPIQYADFAEWQRQWLQGEVLEQKVRPWRQRLAGAPAELGLPTDRPRTASGPSDGRCGYIPLALGAPLSAALRQLARNAGATLYMTLLAGFQVLLFRHSGLPDLVVGSPVASRNRTEIEGLIGVFVNLLAQRGDLTGDPTFEQHLERVRAVAVEALANDDLPFEKLVEELRPDRRLQHTPVFSALFALQQPQVPPAPGAGLRWELADVHPATAKYELSLQLGDEPNEIHGFWDYDADLFDATTIARLSRHLANLLADAAAHPGRRLSELALLDEGEWHQVAVEWNDAASGYPRDATVHGMVAAQAARTPEAPALVWLGDDGTEQVMSYSGLAANARQLARRLRALGVRTESPVAVLLERGPEMVVAWLGVLEAGGTYLPLDPSYPAERIAFMLRDAAVACLVSRSDLAGSLALDSSVPLLDLADLSDRPDRSDRPVAGGAGPENLAYVIYTSGSTGRPKGVAVSHRSVLRLVRSDQSRETFVDFAPPGRMAQLASASFDLAVFEAWGALVNGAPLVMFGRETAVSPQALLPALKQRRIATAFLTSTLFHRAVGLDAAGFRGMPNLLAGGEPVDPSRAAEVLAAGPPVRLLNAYGPTECTVFAVCGEVREVPPGAATVPIGRPIANTAAVVLDERLYPVPAGVTGELCLGGDGLARGYLGRPEVTAERFVPAPFAPGGASEPGARLYRTGDLARLRPDGTIDCLGRADGQVKIRGVRIETGEVEAVLAAHPAIAECAVAARKNPASGELALAAWIVARRHPAPTAQELREHLQTKLPDAMVPALFIGLAALPRTPNGKLDRAALPDPETAGPAARGYVAPRTPVEEVLAGIFASVLRRDRLGRPGQGAPEDTADQIGALDNFFDLGGHSLTATAVTSLVRSTFQVELPTRAIFKEPTLEALAQQIEKLLLARAGLELPPVTPVPRDGDLPLSLAQHHLWSQDERAGGATPFHNITTALRLQGRLDIAALAGAVDEIVRRHEVLRTTFRTGPAGTPVQTVHPHRPVTLPLADLAGLPPERRATEVRRLAALSAARPFSLPHGPLLRLPLLRLDAEPAHESHAVLLTLHRIVADDESLEIFVRELAALYRAFSAGRPSPLPVLPVQFADFAVWQRRWLDGPVLKTQLSFWRQQLEGIPLELDLVRDRPRPELQSYARGSLAVSLPAVLTDRLHALARQNRATLSMTLLTAFAVLLRRSTGRHDILVGSPVANRSRAETAGLIGPFANLLTLRADLSGNPGYGEALGRVREMMLGAYVHQDLPFERLVEELEPARDLSRHPLFQVSFAMAGKPRPAFDIPGLDLSFFDVENAAEPYDLTLQTAETGHGLQAVFSYNPALFDAAAVARLGRHLEILLDALTRDPQQALDSIPLLPEELKPEPDLPGPGK